MYGSSLKEALIKDHTQWINENIERRIMAANRSGKSRIRFAGEELSQEFMWYLRSEGISVSLVAVGYLFDWSDLLNGDDTDA